VFAGDRDSYSDWILLYCCIAEEKYAKALGEEVRVGEEWLRSWWWTIE
jgi:hypothetical protein